MSAGCYLFKAVQRGAPVIVTHATPDEIAALADTVDTSGDRLELWSLIVIRAGSATAVRALGWRLLLADVWLTEPLAAINLTDGAVRTRLGQTYLLGVRDRPELDPDLRAHLTQILRGWGFDAIQPG